MAQPLQFDQETTIELVPVNECCNYETEEGSRDGVVVPKGEAKTASTKTPFFDQNVEQVCCREATGQGQVDEPAQVIEQKKKCCEYDADVAEGAQGGVENAGPVFGHKFDPQGGNGIEPQLCCVDSDGKDTLMNP